VFQSVPAAFQKQAMLRIHVDGFTVTDAPESGLELIDIV
jgi:hypothetical protein